MPLIVIHDKSCVRLMADEMADVIAISGTDGIATRVVGWCVGRWNSQWSALL